jgi:hypothetical protein
MILESLEGLDTDGTQYIIMKACSQGARPNGISCKIDEKHVSEN